MDLDSPCHDGMGGFLSEWVREYFSTYGHAVCRKSLVLRSPLKSTAGHPVARVTPLAYGSGPSTSLQLHRRFSIKMLYLRRNQGDQSVWSDLQLQYNPVLQYGALAWLICWDICRNSSQNQSDVLRWPILLSVLVANFSVPNAHCTALTHWNVIIFYTWYSVGITLFLCKYLDFPW